MPDMYSSALLDYSKTSAFSHHHYILAEDNQDCLGRFCEAKSNDRSTHPLKCVCSLQYFGKMRVHSRRNYVKSEGRLNTGCTVSNLQILTTSLQIEMKL
jgi:hypothetical protein